MIQSQEVSADNKGLILHVSSDEFIKIFYEGNKDWPASIRVEFESNIWKLEHFANMIPLDNLYATDKNKKYAADITVVIGDINNLFVALIGLFSVFFIDFSKRTGRTVYEIKERSIEDDPGFYKNSVIHLDDGFIFNFEYGIVKIDDRGRVLWESKLVYGDSFKEINNQKIVFINEDDEEFFINLNNGLRNDSYRDSNRN